MNEESPLKMYITYTTLFMTPGPLEFNSQSNQLKKQGQFISIAHEAG